MNLEDFLIGILDRQWRGYVSWTELDLLSSQLGITHETYCLKFWEAQDVLNTACFIYDLRSVDLGRSATQDLM